MSFVSALRILFPLGFYWWHSKVNSITVNKCCQLVENIIPTVESSLLLTLPSNASPKSGTTLFGNDYRMFRPGAILGLTQSPRWWSISIQHVLAWNNTFPNCFCYCQVHRYRISPQSRSALFSVPDTSILMTLSGL